MHKQSNICFISGHTMYSCHSFKNSKSTNDKASKNMQSKRSHTQFTRADFFFIMKSMHMKKHMVLVTPISEAFLALHLYICLV